MRIDRAIFSLVLLLSVFVVGIRSSDAGIGYNVTCSDGKCGFSAKAGIGGGMQYEEAAGYCPKCGTWTSVSWRRRKTAPVPVAAFWDPQTGTQRQVRACTKCSEPFVVITRIEDMKYCPKCGKPTLTSKRTLMYD